MTRTVRQLAGGFLYALVSVLLVVGSISLTVAQQHPVTPAAPGVTSRATGTPAETASAVPSISETQSAGVPFISTPVVFPTARVVRQPTSAPTEACGPFAGWIRGYTVQSGDTLFGISMRYHTTVSRLQTANCRTGSAIFSGELLWVPNVRMPTPGITIIPTFDTPTDRPTESVATAQPTLTLTVPPTYTLTPDP